MGPEHCEVASVLDVLQQTMAYLMARDRNALLGCCEEWLTFAAVSKAHYAFAKRCKQLTALYDSALLTRDGASSAAH